MIVVFDISNVLLRWDPRNLFQKVFADRPTMERFLREACAMDWIAQTDRVPSFADAVEERVAAFPEFANALRLFDSRWMETLGGPIDENVALLARLKNAGAPVYALSNFAREKFALALAAYPFLGSFTDAVISGHEGVTKPDRRIFEILVERAGRSPKELLFVDDSLKNIEAAAAFGLHTVHYGPGVDLERELSARGVLLA